MTEDTYQWPEEAIVLSDAPKPEVKAQSGYWVGGLFREILSTVLPAVLIAVLMHLFLAQSSVVYGESMQPNFFTDQRLIVEKVSYHLRAPERGEVVILRDPDGGALPLIKRVVGLPGERVTVAGGRVYIDGLALDEPYLDEPTDGASRSWVVPPFRIFVMGDNRNNSRDSRFFGPIPTDSLLGHAVFRYWPLNELGRPRELHAACTSLYPASGSPQRGDRPMTTRLYLIRHGATVLSAEDRFAGSTNVELSPTGRAQAEALARRLADDKVRAVYASPLKRTLETATIIGQPHGQTPILHDGLREIDHGHWEGLRRSDVESQFPDEYAAWEEDPFTFAPQGGESGISVLARALPVIREIVLQHDDENVVVVSHKATIRLLISSLLGFDGRGYRDRLDQSPACLNVMDFKGPVRARLMVFNDVSHYVDQPPRADARLSKWWDEEQQPG